MHTALHSYKLKTTNIINVIAPVKRPNGIRESCSVEFAETYSVSVFCTEAVLLGIWGHDQKFACPLAAPDKVHMFSISVCYITQLT